MPLFRNIRNSLSRGRSSSRDTTPVRVTRPASYTGNTPVQRRDSSVDSRTDSFFSRSDTFILDAQPQDDQRSQNSSNTSTPENKSKKSKMFSKFSTFSKRKKPIASPKDLSLDHHPSEHATNTYYKWQSEGPSTLDYDAKLDPFNFLYEQPSSLMEIQNKGVNTEPIRTNSIGTHYDSITVRRSKHSRDAALSALQLKEQLAAEQTASHKKRNAPEPQPEHPVQSEPEEEKFRTVTINSFRKSFRDRLLNQKNDVPHNPAWFVEVEEPVEEPRLSRLAAKENNSEVLIFANENYRPLTRSPVRDHKSNSLRSSMSSPIRRNETFRIDRHLYEQTLPNSSPPPSIRIEIKNSITPNVPGRMVPVGVAKPMPSSSSSSSPNTNSFKLRMPASSSTTLSNSKNYAVSTKRHSDLDGWLKPVAAHTHTASAIPKVPAREGRYQTLVQIRSDSANAAQAAQSSPSPPLLNNRRQPLRIQLSSSASSDNNCASQTTLQYCNLSTKSTQQTSSQAPSTERYEQPSTLIYMKPVSKTYFGDCQRSQQNAAAKAAATSFKQRSSKSSGRCAPVESASKLQTRSYFMDSIRPHSSQQHQRSMSATTVTAPQRRSRSPIKMPWR